MEKCFDIKGNEIISIALGDDGIAYGLDENQNITYTLSAECCSNFGYNFNPEEAICYWSDIKTSSSINVIINSDEDSGGLFYQPEDSICDLNIFFDYLIYLRCDSEKKCDLVYDNLSKLKISYILQIIDLNGLIEQIDEVLLMDFNNFNLLSQNNNGVYFNDGSKECGYKLNRLVNDYIDNGLQLTINSFNSNWVSFNKLYNDSNFLDSIQNKKIRIGFKVENLPCGLSIKADNIKINNRCLNNSVTTTKILKNPSFSIEKVIDNKKTWLETDDERLHDLKYRETNYNAADDNLILNSKETDLYFSSDNGIEHDLWIFIKNNPELINNISYDGIDINKLLDFDFNECNNLIDFINLLNINLIDVKSRKTISGYPLLKLVYYRYVNSFLYTGVSSNAFTYNDMLRFIGILDNYWLELIEQFIPSTTIWGSTIKIGNSMFDSEKFKYKKNSLVVVKKNGDLNNYLGTKFVNVSEENLGTGEIINYSTGVGIYQINDGSEFYGVITTIMSGINEIGDNTIILSESKDSSTQKI